MLGQKVLKIYSSLTAKLKAYFKDNAIGLTATISSISNGGFLLLTAFFVLTKFSSEEQGFFFTFLSFAALIQLFDFGLSYAGLQTASHFKARNDINTLNLLSRQLYRYSILSALVAFPIISLIGNLVLLQGSMLSVNAVQWHYQWFLFALCVSVNLPLNTRLALIEGCGSVLKVWQLRALQEWIAGIVLLVCLAMGLKLWSLSLAWLARALVSLFFVYENNNIFLDANYISSDQGTKFNWKHDVWPFQWRIALSILSGFLIFRSFSPIIMLVRGPILAGQFGLAIAIMNLLIAFSTAWPSSQAVKYGFFISQGKVTELLSEIKRMVINSSALAFILFVFSSAAIVCLIHQYGQFSTRLPPATVTVIVLLNALIHHIVICFAIPLRAERREPLLAVSVIGSVITAVLVWGATVYSNSMGIAVIHLVCTLSGLIVTTIIFKNRLIYWKLNNNAGC